MSFRVCKARWSGVAVVVSSLISLCVLLTPPLPQAPGWDLVTTMQLLAVGFINCYYGFNRGAGYEFKIFIRWRWADVWLEMTRLIFAGRHLLGSPRCQDTLHYPGRLQTRAPTCLHLQPDCTINNTAHADGGCGFRG